MISKDLKKHEENLVKTHTSGIIKKNSENGFKEPQNVTIYQYLHKRVFVKITIFSLNIIVYGK